MASNCCISLNRNRVGSLLTLSINCIVRDFPTYFSTDRESLAALPCHIKNKILQKITRTFRWNKRHLTQYLPVLLQSTTKFLDLTSIEIVDDDLLKQLAVCTDLRELLLTRPTTNTTSNSAISTQALLDLFARTPLLNFVQLSNCDAFNDQVLQCLATNCLNLIGISASGCRRISDYGVKCLSKMTNLSGLMLSNTDISDVGIGFLVEDGAGGKIKELRLDNCENISDRALVLIAKNCPNIEILTYYNSNNFDQTAPTTDSFYEDISSCKALKQLTWTVPW